MIDLTTVKEGDYIERGAVWKAINIEHTDDPKYPIKVMLVYFGSFITIGDGSRFFKWKPRPNELCVSTGDHGKYLVRWQETSKHNGMFKCIEQQDGNIVYIDNLEPLVSLHFIEPYGD